MFEEAAGVAKGKYDTYKGSTQASLGKLSVHDDLGNMILIKDRHEESLDLNLVTGILMGNMILIKDRHSKSFINLIKFVFFREI